MKQRKSHYPPYWHKSHDVYASGYGSFKRLVIAIAVFAVISVAALVWFL